MIKRRKRERETVINRGCYFKRVIFVVGKKFNLFRKLDEIYPGFFFR